MTPSRALSPAAAHRLDELLDEWAYWFTRRMSDAPGLEAPSSHGMAMDTSRQWKSTFELDGERLAQVVQDVDRAIDALPEQHRRVLQTWAWVHYYNRSVQRRVREQAPAVFRSNLAILTDEALAAAKEALVRLLPAFGVALPD